MFGWGVGMTNSRFGWGGGGTAFDADALTFIAAHEAATGETMQTQQRNTINGTYLLLKGGNAEGINLIAAGVISRWFCYAPSADSGANAAKAAGFALDLLNNAAGAFIGFLSGDFDPTGATGGPGKHLDMNYNPVSEGDSTGDFGFGTDAASVLSASDAVSVMMGSRNGGNGNYTALYYLSGNIMPRIAETMVWSSPYTGSLPVGLLIADGDGTTRRMYLDGVELFNQGYTPTGFYDGNIYGHCSNIQGNALHHDRRKFRGFIITKYLTANQQIALAECWAYFQDNIITGGR